MLKGHRLATGPTCIMFQMFGTSGRTTDLQTDARSAIAKLNSTKATCKQFTIDDAN